METNPYAASHLPAENMPDATESFAWAGDKVFRDGSLLVIHCTAPFPPICVGTGEPANEIVDIELSCIGKDDYSIYNPNTENLTFGKLRSFLLYQPRRFKFSVPVSQAWKRQYSRGKTIVRVLIVTALSLVAIGLFILGYDTYVQKLYQVNRVAIAAILCGIALLIIATILDSRLHYINNIVHIEKGYFYISGASKRMLAQLDDSPMPLPWWRRILF
jgi:hypothetical protein